MVIFTHCVPRTFWVKNVAPARLAIKQLKITVSRILRPWTPMTGQIWHPQKIPSTLAKNTGPFFQQTPRQRIPTASAQPRHRPPPPWKGPVANSTTIPPIPRRNRPSELTKFLTYLFPFQSVCVLVTVPPKPLLPNSAQSCFG